MVSAFGRMFQAIPDEALGIGIGGAIGIVVCLLFRLILGG